MPNFTPPETDIEDLPSLPESETPAQPTAPLPALAPFAGHLVPLNPLLEAIAAYKSDCGLDPAKHIFPDSKPAVIRERFHEYKMRGARLRGDIIAIAKQTREEALRFQRDVIAAEKNLVKEVEAVEEVWAAEVEKIDAAVAKEKSDKQRVENTLIAKRVTLLREIGIPINAMGLYQADGETISDSTPLVDPWQGERLSKMTETVFQAHYTIARQVWEELERVRLEKEAEFKRLQAAEAERVRLGAEAEAKARAQEAERLETQRLAQEAERQRLDTEAARVRAEQAEAQRKLDEQAAAQRAEADRLAGLAAEAAEKARKDLLALRISQLQAVHFLLEDTDLTGEEIAAMPQPDFDALLADATEKDRLHTIASNLLRERTAIWNATPGHELVEIPLTLHKLSAEEFQEYLDKAAAALKAKQEADALAASEAAARLDALKPDIEKLKAYGDAIYQLALKVPELSTEEAKARLSSFASTLVAAIGEMNA